ncbi:hypothetical protein A2442_02215 [Candidatus Campbellbacteria bacterium RIFOXYC2_FULL_35_25]|uniref:Uncharacterized protein n=1 Tax=Candidatus Campbellbacteria bacterium RIFOXYC2_FULL_35_25 TaxID=1797582 RepID=A0A1F5EII3_9BACT|nr:MAG: hypothetical protein A2442_02215 [Candidatus Campbellbacteria bacterium RIFOXYC2_FULL_35_25]
MKRQTKLTLKELLAQLSSPRVFSEGCCEGKWSLPVGLLANEVGTIFCTGGEDSSAAEEILIKILAEDHNPNTQVAAYGFLSLGEPTEQGLEALTVFKNNPENAEIVRFAERVTQEMKEAS